MTSDRDAFHESVYVQSFQEITNLNERLPTDTIIALAREVIRHVTVRARAVTAPDVTVADTSVENLARALISTDDTAAAAMIRNLRTSGTSIADVYLLHLAQAARKLGEWWETNHISMTDVTVGTGRIYAIMRGLSDAFALPVATALKTAFFTNVPGETHTIGIKMAADLLRNDGWDIDLRLGATKDAITDEIRTTQPRIVGLSAGGAHALGDLAQLVIAIRLVAPATAIIIGGNITDETGDLVGLMGADAIVSDFAQTKSEMTRLWQASIAVQSV